VNPRAASSSETVFLPGPVLLLGAPGVGKGTQAQALMAEFAIPQISTGDILRANIVGGTELGLKAKFLMDQGLLVDDEIVQDMVGNRLVGHKDVERGFILDGFPRTLGQAGWLETLFESTRHTMERAEWNKHGLTLPVVAISINLSYDELLRRITGRRTCSACKHIYNLFSNPPRVAGLCDFDGAALVQRADDTEDVFAERMKTFEAQTAPVIDYYRRQGRFEEVDGNKPVKAVTEYIQAALRRLRGQGAD
jgi:adenylate kinase